MDPHVRHFADPLEGLHLQLEELTAFARAVPRVIEAHREEVWDQVMAQPGDPDEDPLDAYANAIDEGPGGGFANFERTVYIASIALGFEAFMDYLALNLAKRERVSRFWGRTTVRDALEEEITRLDFPKLIARFKKQQIYPRKLPEWDDIEEIQFTRNALVHNHGLYNRQYFNGVKNPRYPTKDDTHGMDYTHNMTESEKKEWLVDREEIPLNFEYVSVSLKSLAAFATRIENS
jgi:hypothetical protein